MLTANAKSYELKKELPGTTHDFLISEKTSLNALLRIKINKLEPIILALNCLLAFRIENCKHQL